MKNQKKTVIYETDDINKVTRTVSNCNDVLVVYYNRSRSIPPTLTFIIDGKSYTKYNPEYIEYLKEKFPGISDDEIGIYMQQKMFDNVEEKTKNLKLEKDN